MRFILLFALLGFATFGIGQVPDQIYHSNIRSVKLSRSGDPLSYPVIHLGSNEQMELRFDDMDGNVKNYYYSFQLCNADWTPANVQTYDYIRGFQSSRITFYRISTLIQTRYTHYQASLPDRNITPTRGGNYLLKVFLNDDTTRLAFTRRFLVINKKTNISAQVLQPFSGALFNSHQRVQVGVSTAGNQLNAFSPQDIKVVILQNNIWNTASTLSSPTIFRGNYYEYSDEDKSVFPAGKEWRWVDLRSLRLRSDRVQMIRDSDSSKRVDIYVNPDQERSKQLYVYYLDLNGLFVIENQDGNNPFWQSDYAWVHFTFVPPGNRAYEGKSVYIYGELNNYETKDASKMEFNEEKGAYEKSLYLKQGYYNYSYVTVPDKNQKNRTPVLENTEGNFWGTENGYMVLVYFRPFGARSDELIGFTTVNSAFVR